MNEKFLGPTEITVTAYTAGPVDIGFNAKRLILVNDPDSQGALFYSLNGSTNAGKLRAGEPFNEQGGKFLVRRIWFKKENAGETVKYRLWARD